MRPRRDCGRLIVCVHVPRFELRVATGDRSEIGQQELLGRAVAIAPSGGGAMQIGEVSPSAQAQGCGREWRSARRLRAARG